MLDMADKVAYRKNNVATAYVLGAPTMLTRCAEEILYDADMSSSTYYLLNKDKRVTPLTSYLGDGIINARNKSSQPPNWADTLVFINCRMSSTAALPQNSIELCEDRKSYPHRFFMTSFSPLAKLLKQLAANGHLLELAEKWGTTDVFGNLPSRPCKAVIRYAPQHGYGLSYFNPVKDRRSWVKIPPYVVVAAATQHDLWSAYAGNYNGVSKIDCLHWRSLSIGKASQRLREEVRKDVEQGARLLLSLPSIDGVVDMRNNTQHLHYPRDSAALSDVATLISQRIRGANVLRLFGPKNILKQFYKKELFKDIKGKRYISEEDCVAGIVQV